MSKVIVCPECSTIKAVREDANVCSSNCRVKHWRKRKMTTFIYRLECKNEILNGSQIQTRANTRKEADEKVKNVLLDSKLSNLGTRCVFVR